MSDARIMSNGEAAVWLRPSTMLLQVQLIESADEIEAALRRLKARVVSARHRLEQLEATDIEFGPFLLGDPVDSDPLGQMQMAKRMAAIRARKPTFGRSTAPAPQPDVDVIVRTRATAQWTLKSDSDDDRVTFVDTIRRRLAGIDGTDSEAEQPGAVWPTPEEEMQAMMSAVTAASVPVDYRSPHFYFVTWLSHEQEQDLIAAALVRARDSAERLARSSGRSLGEVVYLTQAPVSDYSNHEFLTKQRLSGDQWPQITEATPNVVWDDLRKVRFVIRVTATFSLV